jgi:hypothetical protein
MTKPKRTLRERLSFATLIFFTGLSLIWWALSWPFKGDAK